MSRLAERRSALGDEYVESYVCWREACEDVEAAYRRWADSAPEEQDLGFANYRAALDREEHAASIYSVSVHRLGAIAR